MKHVCICLLALALCAASAGAQAKRSIYFHGSKGTWVSVDAIHWQKAEAHTSVAAAPHTIVFHGTRGSSVSYDGGASWLSLGAERRGEPEAESAAAESRLHIRGTEGSIAFRVPLAGRVTLRLYDLLGRPVITALDAEAEAGAHRMRFDMAAVPGGVYVWTLQGSGLHEGGTVYVP